MISIVFALALSAAPVEVHQLSPISFECVCHSDEAPAGFDCSSECREATQAYIRTHEATPAESCRVNLKNCVDVEEVK